MLIILPPPQLLRALEVASWMLFPDEIAVALRKSFRASVKRTRYLTAYSHSKEEQVPHPYIWRSSGTDELMLIPAEPGNGSKAATPILGDDDGALLSIVSEMMALERESGLDKSCFALGFRKGFTAGAVLLACYIFDSDQALGHKSSKARATIAAAHITGLKERSVETFFREFNSVAHLWAAYHLCAAQRFLEVESCGILQYTKHGISDDFLDGVALEQFLSISDQLADYGKQKRTAKTTLLTEAELIRFSPIPSGSHPIHSSAAMIEVFLKNYPPGKRDSRA